MEKQSFKSIRVVITASIVALGLYCAVFKVELYPFAPYTMYSHLQKISNNDFFEFYCESGGNDIRITNEMSRPLDEARLGVSVSESYYKQDYSSVISKLTSLRELIVKNNFQCEKTRLKVVRFDDPETFLAKKGRVIQTLASGDTL